MVGAKGQCFLNYINNVCTSFQKNKDFLLLFLPKNKFKKISKGFLCKFNFFSTFWERIQQFLDILKILKMEK
jgi:hypothetical protein